MMNKTRIWMLVILLTSCFSFVLAGQIISVASFGLKPDSRINAVPFVKKAIDACRKQPGSTLFFPKGRYDFWAQYTTEKDYYETNTTDNNPKTLAILLEQINDLTVDGNGSQFIMHGRMQPLTMDHCTNISLKNFSVDWDIPLTSQAKVINVSSNYMDLEIDAKEYPYIVKDNRLIFIGEGWQSECWGMMQFDPQTHFILPNTGDNLGWKRFFVEALKPGVVRVIDSKASKYFPAPNTLLVLRHNERDHSGIFIFHSKNLKLENIDIYHTCGLGILSQYSTNIAMNKVRVVPNEAKQRILSGHDDGFHFMGCNGLLKIENCSWAGLMDDPINIHGTCVRIIEVLSPTRLKCKFMHNMSEGLEWGRVGEKVAFIENQSMRTVATTQLTSFQPINKSEFIVDLSTPIPETIKAGAALENLTCTADVEIRNNHFGSCRARGLLVSTPGKVLIENNVFESSGSAILIAGDANEWYESGAVKDVLIRNNTFRYPCMSSSYQFCEAVISIYPEIPLPDERYPFHRNIRIENNEFQLFDYPILYAKSVEGLTFSNNKLVRDTTYKPSHHRKAGITLDVCKKVTITGNTALGDVLGYKVILENTKKSEVNLKNERFFRLK